MVATEPSASTSPTDDQPGHPRGLYMLFFAEMWERFSFYGMRALLVLYMVKHFGFSDENAYVVYGSYTALVYSTPVFGGMIADRVLGYRKSVLLGGVLMALGHFAMAFDALFYLALGLLIVGNGFFKPNISTMVGKLYSPGDRRRDSGFTLFYMGINLGALLAPLSCGPLGENVDWHYGFGLAGVGMLCGLAVFTWGRGRVAGIAEPPDPEYLRGAGPLGIRREFLVYAGACAAVVVAWQLVQRGAWVGSLLSVVGVVVSVVLVTYLLRLVDPVERQRMVVALVLIAVSVVFWSFFEQAGSSMNLFTDRNVDRTLPAFLGGAEIPASAFQSVNPAFVLLLAPPFILLWGALGRRGLEPSTPLKFGLGIVQLGLGFGALYFGATSAPASGIVPVFWLLLGYMLHTSGELCVSPIGLSMITKLSPVKIVGLMMGTWFLSSSFAHYVAGLIAALTGVQGGGEPGAGKLPPPAETVGVYGGVFGGIAVVALVVGVIVMLVAPLLARRTHGIR
jgi:POT family proton-dependent oligopeptide transporter